MASRHSPPLHHLECPPNHYVASDALYPRSVYVGHPNCETVASIRTAPLSLDAISMREVQADGHQMGDLTMKAIRRYEEEEWLVLSDAFMRSTTWHALMETEDVPAILHVG